MGNVIYLVSCQTLNNSYCVLPNTEHVCVFWDLAARLLLIIIRSSVLIINNGPALIDVFFLTFNSVRIELFSCQQETVSGGLWSLWGVGCVDVRVWLLPVTSGQPPSQVWPLEPNMTSPVVCRPPPAAGQLGGTVSRLLLFKLHLLWSNMGWDNFISAVDFMQIQPLLLTMKQYYNIWEQWERQKYSI